MISFYASQLLQVTKLLKGSCQVKFDQELNWGVVVGATRKNEVQLPGYFLQKAKKYV